MEQNQPKKFLKSLDEKSRVFVADKVVRKEKLGEGDFAPVYTTEIWKDGVKYLFAVKDYGEEIETLRAFEGYLMAKAAGLTVFPTVRISEDHKQLIMTLGTDENFFLVGKNSEYEWNRVEEISNIEDIIEKMEKDVLKASKNKIIIPQDAQFFVVEKSNPNNATYILGDYDFVGYQFYENDSERRIFLNNVSATEMALHNFCLKYLEIPQRTKYKKLIESHLNDFMKKNITKFSDEFS